MCSRYSPNFAMKIDHSAPLTICLSGSFAIYIIYIASRRHITNFTTTVRSKVGEKVKRSQRHTVGLKLKTQ